MEVKDLMNKIVTYITTGLALIFAWLFYSESLRVKDLEVENKNLHRNVLHLNLRINDLEYSQLYEEK